ncbi:uncharacterized protein [Palaemon carinicauda]|uniref:uncharacterized protein n=1 Tax=Palaemon carinicauda TaxID=392227 RepID=UPI0035B6985C
MKNRTMYFNTMLVGSLLTMILGHRAMAGPAESRSLFPGLFKSKLGDLYKLRDALQNPSDVSSAEQLTPSTTTELYKIFPKDKGESESVLASLTDLLAKDEGTPQLIQNPQEVRVPQEILSDHFYSQYNENISPHEIKHSQAKPETFYSQNNDNISPQDIHLSQGIDPNNYGYMNDYQPKPNAYQVIEEDMQEHNSFHVHPEASISTGGLETSNNVIKDDYFGNDIGNLTDLHSQGEEVPQEYWTRVKGIVGNMKSILEQMYPPQSEEEKRTFSVFDKAIAFGDNINVLNKIRKTFDHELVGFLGQKWTDIKDRVVNGSPLLKFILSMNTRNITKNFMMALIQQLGHLLHQQAFTHLSEMDFVTELMRSSGFKDIEIQQVFQLLDLPTDTIGNEISEAEARQLGGYSGYNVEKSGGYGHSGGGGYGGGGGGYMQSFDPFVLLAGLAFATFLAYLLYRLLSSTTGRKRDIPDISLALDLSDLPDVVGNIYSWLEKAEEKYGGDEYHGDIMGEVIDESESFGTAANQLWTSFQADRMSHACVKRYLCDYASKTSKKMMGHNSILQQLALTSLAQLFGEDEGAKLMDKIQHDTLGGKEATCSARAADCDDITYQDVVTTATADNASITLSGHASSPAALATELTVTVSPDAILRTDPK